MVLMPRVILNLLVVALGCLAVTARADEVSGHFDFTAQKVERGEWQPHLTAQGQVVAEREVALSLPFPALIKTVPIYGDQFVKEGQVLAQLDPSPLVGLLSDLQTANRKVELAQQHLSITTQRFHEKLATRDDLLQAQESLNIATSDLKNSWLAANNVLLRLGDTVSEAALLKQLKESTADVIAQHHSEIHAPFEGIVAQRMVGPESQVAAGQSLFVVDNMSHVFVSLLIPPSQLDQWKEGTVYARTDTGKVTLSLLSKAPSIDPPTGLVDLKFQADNPQGEFLDGEWVDVILEAKPLPVLWVPESAVVERDGKTYCVRRHEKTYESVEVKVGSATNGRLPVLSGLQAGDEVVVQNAYLLLYRDLKDIMKRAAD
jgi:multidrug efflux pump subunit AcrA (membrane-fusion protein)